MTLRYKPPKNEREVKKSIYYINIIIGILLIAGIMFAVLMLNSNVAIAANGPATQDHTITSANQVQNANNGNDIPHMRSTTQAQRQAAAAKKKQIAAAAGVIIAAPALVQLPGMGELETPDYWGFTPNFANSPLPPVVNITGGNGTGAEGLATVQSGVVTAVMVINGGTGYNSTPDVAITGMDGTGAMAVATIMGPVTALTITNGGSGYTSVPSVIIAPSAGTTATATANVAYDIVSEIAVAAQGNGYTAPVVTIDPPTTGTQATATATGSVDNILVTQGTGYTTASITIDPPTTGTQATATAAVDGSGFITVTITDNGSGYTSAPFVNLTGDGTGAAATATINVTKVTIANGGSGYTSVPLVSIVDSGIGTGTGALATATVSGAVTGFVITNPGSGYTSAPLVTIDAPVSGTQATATATITGPVTAITVTSGGNGYGGIRKFVDSLPGLTAANANNLGNYLPIAIPDNTTYPGSDYYEIELNDYTQKMHSDLAPTKLRGYRQTNTADPTVNNFSYMGPVIVAQKDRPVRIKFTNKLPPNAGGNLFIPVDPTVMGAGPYNINWDPVTKQPLATNKIGNFSQNRATLHLHGGDTPWISDGTQHQWITPAGENTNYPKGVSVGYVPDQWYNSTNSYVPIPSCSLNTMCTAPGATNNPGNGSLTFYYTNGQSARLMFYHDHAYGITRLNVYAGEAAGYLEQDPVEQGLVNNGTIPKDEIPLIIQDKTFVPGPNQLAAQDPTWNTAKYGNFSNLWLPHVYMPNQNPDSIMGANAMGRWDYGPYFWPVFPVTNGPVPNPYCLPTPGVNCSLTPWEAPTIPGLPNPSIVPESFLDTPIVNGVAYPNITVEPKAYRLRILNAANDRFLNLQLYQAANSSSNMWDANGNLADPNAGDVNMVPFNSNQNLITPFPAWWYTSGNPFVLDDRAGGVPDPRTRGPAMIQIGTEGGFLPAPTIIRNQPINFNYNRRDIVVLNVLEKALFLGPAERADVIVDFSNFAGKTLILYNDAPAPVPAGDPRNDYYTGGPDQTDTGGAPTTLPGYGPNTRTIMQIKVSGSGGSAPLDDVNATIMAALEKDLPVAYSQTQNKPQVPQAAYNTAFNAFYPVDAYERIQSNNMTFQNGALSNIVLTNGGAGYTLPPNATFIGGGGTGATATATLAPTYIASLTLTNGGSGYSSAPSVTLSGGGGTGATATATLATRSVASITVTNGGSGYISAPIVTISLPQTPGGVRATANATVQPSGQRRVTGVVITNPGSGYTSAPTVSFTAVNGGTGAAATAALGTAAVASLNVTNGGSGYSSAPTVSFSGGGGTGAAATANLGPCCTVAYVTLTNEGYGYTSAPVVSIQSANGIGSGATANVNLKSITMNNQPKSIQELFDPAYGRMNSLLGVEIPATTAITQTTIPYEDIDPPTEIFKYSDISTAIGSTADGSQIWKITHNGVDTHALHWHMFNVQVINRVGWDGAIRPPDANELGWKDTVRMNPLEDIIVAMRPVLPTVPFELPNSIRPLDVTAVTGSTMDFLGVDPTNQPAPVTNQMVNYGWEYLWHCHLLGHEENIMMRTMAVSVTPKDPIIGTATRTGTGNSQKAILTWTDNSTTETSFTIQSAPSASGPWTDYATVASSTGPSKGPVSYTTANLPRRTTFYFRVIANNVVGYTQTYAAPAVGYPITKLVSGPSAPSGSIATN